MQRIEYIDRDLLYTEEWLIRSPIPDLYFIAGGYEVWYAVKYQSYFVSNGNRVEQYRLEWRDDKQCWVFRKY